MKNWFILDGNKSKRGNIVPTIYPDEAINLRWTLLLPRKIL
ncbi:hypothetical protein BN2127_JRS7_02066 [Bacillus subtilis]|nr:hypothetical protein BN2127_JRS7_02066 [Bacillus subtilis]